MKGTTYVEIHKCSANEIEVVDFALKHCYKYTNLPLLFLFAFMFLQFYSVQFAQRDVRPSREKKNMRCGLTYVSVSHGFV